MHAYVARKVSVSAILLNFIETDICIGTDLQVGVEYGEICQKSLRNLTPGEHWERAMKIGPFQEY